MEGIKTREKALAAARAALGKKAADIVVFDLDGISGVADYFVICSGATARQVKAIVEAIDEALGASRVSPHHVEGTAGWRWVLMDYQDVVVHVFDEETRRYYDLDGLWGDAPVVEL